MCEFCQEHGEGKKWYPMDLLPEEFMNRLIDLHGQTAREWLAGLPLRVQALEEKWQIQASDPLQSLNYHYLASARRRDGSEAMLKLGIPGDSIAREAECLRWFAGHGAPNLLEYDSDQGAMLIERIRPGSNIKQLDEPQALSAAANVIGKLHRPLQSAFPFPSVHDWGRGFRRLRDRYNGGTGPLPSDLIDEGEGIFTSLAHSMAPSVVLHGDLHHENILAGERQPWFAIDPKGVIGEPSYEVGAFLRNPIHELIDWPDLGNILKNRIARFSEILGFDRRRVAGWGFAQAVLSAIWSLEDHGSGWEYSLAVARVLGEVHSL